MNGFLGAHGPGDGTRLPLPVWKSAKLPPTKLHPDLSTPYGVKKKEIIKNLGISTSLCSCFLPSLLRTSIVRGDINYAWEPVDLWQS
jgi:hypothetical protein